MLLSMYGTAEMVSEMWNGVDCKCEFCVAACAARMKHWEEWMDKNGLTEELKNKL